jgi:hypothetical protein
MLPVVLAATLVYVDTIWTLILVPLLFLVYFYLQLFFIKAKNDWFVFAISMMVGYTSGLIFMINMKEEPIPLNYMGWFCIALFMTLTFAKSIKYFRQ